MVRVHSPVSTLHPLRQIHSDQLRKCSQWTCPFARVNTASIAPDTLRPTREVFAVDVSIRPCQHCIHYAGYTQTNSGSVRSGRVHSPVSTLHPLRQIHSDQLRKCSQWTCPFARVNTASIAPDTLRPTREVFAVDVSIRPCQHCIHYAGYTQTNSGSVRSGRVHSPVSTLHPLRRIHSDQLGKCSQWTLTVCTPLAVLT